MTLLVARREARDDLGLQAVRVLVLVDHDVAVGARQLLGDRSAVAEQVAQQDQQVVVVEQMLARACRRRSGRAAARRSSRWSARCG